MAARKTVTYVCEVCGTELTVNSEGMSNLSPIYCCGISLSEGGRGEKKKPASKTSSIVTGKKKTVSRTAAKKGAGAAPRRTTKKSSLGKRTRK